MSAQVFFPFDRRTSAARHSPNNARRVNKPWPLTCWHLLLARRAGGAHARRLALRRSTPVVGLDTPAFTAARAFRRQRVVSPFARGAGQPRIAASGPTSAGTDGESNSPPRTAQPGSYPGWCFGAQAVVAFALADAFARDDLHSSSTRASECCRIQEMETSRTRPGWTWSGSRFGTDATLTGNLCGARAAHRHEARRPCREDAARSLLL